jgi:hypothetical protein
MDLSHDSEETFPTGRTPAPGGALPARFYSVAMTSPRSPTAMPSGIVVPRK